MKKILLFLLCFSVWPVFAQNAIPFCMSMTTEVKINTRVTTPKYNTFYSRSEFLRKAKQKPNSYTLGLTVFEMAVDTKTIPALEERFGQICVGISELDIDLYYPDITVYIDKKYNPSSCEYQVIKDHENYHVRVAEKALPFFKKDVEKAATKALTRLSPKIVYSEEDVQPTLKRMAETVMESIKPVIRHINKKLKEKNMAIDTKEMYEATSKMCKHW